MLKKFCTNSQSRPAGAAHLRRKPPRRRYGADDPLSSHYRILAGADRGFAPSPPANEGSQEVRSSHSHQLRRNKPSKELVPSSGERPSRRSCALRYPSSSYYRILAGAKRGFTLCPPTNKGSPEVRISHSHLIRRNKP